jgi:hypothetical protein
MIWLLKCTPECSDEIFSNRAFPEWQEEKRIIAEKNRQEILTIVRAILFGKKYFQIKKKYRWLAGEFC